MTTENILFDDNTTSGGYEIAAGSGIGNREEQQDAAYWYAGETIVYAVVCDGMGGLTGGGIASLTAVNIAREAFEKNGSKPITEKVSWMADAIIKADRSVSAITFEDDDEKHAGSTFVSVFIKDDSLYWASVGDSRIYLIHGNECFQLTTDLNYQFYLDQQRSAEKIDEEKYREEMKMGDALTSFVGMGDVSIIDRNIEPLKLIKGDTLLLCTDGLYRTIDEKWMCDIISFCDSPKESMTYIHQIIEEYGNDSQDNYTCILIRI